MPGTLRETKLTDFFQRRPSLLLNDDPPQTLSQPPTLRSPRSSSGDLRHPPVVAKRKPGRPKGSGKKGKNNHDQPTHVPSKPSSLSGGGSGSRKPCFLASGSSPPGPSTSGPSSIQRSRKPKGERKRALTYHKEAYLSRSSPKVDPQNSPSIQALTPSKRSFDDTDDTASVTSSGVPLSLYYMPWQISSPRFSKAPVSPLTIDDLSSPSNKRRRLVPRSHQAPVTPKKARGNEIIPTSQSSEVGLYSPTRTDPISRRRNDVQESVENWRHSQSAYRCEIISPLQISPGGDYSTENDRPISPLTSCPKSTSPGSPLSSFTDIDPIPSDIDLDSIPAPLPQHTLPTPSSSSEGKPHPPFTQLAVPSPVRPVTPPPSSPEQEQPTPMPVAPKDSEMRTAEIIAEIWANVRARSVSDGEDSYLHLHAPLKDELSSEEEDDEPFWKRKVTKSRHLTLTSITSGTCRNDSHPSLPSPSSPSPVSPDDSLPQLNGLDDRVRHAPDLPIYDPVSPLVDRSKRLTRTRHPTCVVNNTSTQVAKSDVRKADPIKAMLRERKREARVGGGIEALNCAEGYDHDTLLSDFSIDEAEEESIDNAAPPRSSSVDQNAVSAGPTGPQTDGAGADIAIAANLLEDEVQQDERERLLGTKEGEAVGKILEADRKMGQTMSYNVPGVSVFVDNHEETEVDEACLKWEFVKDKAGTLGMLSEAIEQQDVEYMQAAFSILTSKDIAVPGIAQWLCEQALWHGHEHLGRFSLKFFLEMPLWAQSYLGSPLSVALLVETMMRLGLRADLSNHVQPLRSAPLPHLRNRPRVLRSMVKMVASFAPLWSMEQLPDVVIVLLLIGVDVNTTTELRRDILHSISLLCRRLPEEPGDDTEISLSQRVLDLTMPFSPTDQALLLSFFTKGSPSSLRISRAVAYHVLTGSAISPASYALPPLGPLMTVLSDPDEQFGITDSTDYDALTSRIAVLGVALSGIEGYVAEESMLRKLANISEGSPRKRESMPLEQIRARLDAIHGKIFDTRAAHLDRSRAKGALQRVSMRVHYQRAALSKTGGQLRLGDFKFFSPGTNSRQPKRRNCS